MMKLREIKKALRAGKYAWPGGYPLYFVAADGEALSFEAVRGNWRSIVWAHMHQEARCTDWTIAGVEVNWEDENLYCAHRGEKIESAYGN